MTQAPKTILYHPSLLIPVFILIGVACLMPPTGYADTEMEIISRVQLDDKPLDTVFSRDGSKAYILCKKSILLYTVEEDRITDTIPLTESFSAIALSPGGDRLILTDPKRKELTVITLVYDIETGRSPVIGSPDAPISVVAFIDFQCPYCARAYPDLERLLEKYPGKVNLVLKHYPLRSHKFAKQAALAALAAGRQGKHREMSSILMKNYKQINAATIKTYAKNAGLDMAKFETDLKDPRLATIMDQDMDVIKKINVRSVPAIYINGRYSRQRSVDVLSRIIENEIEKASK